MIGQYYFRKGEKMTERLLTVPMVAERLCLRESTVRKMILQRRIDVVRPSVRAVRVPESAIERILKEGYRPAVKGSAEGE
jgi:excisionase family DNA binding protein